MGRAIILAEGHLGKRGGKTTTGLLLHSIRDEIVAVIDSTEVGRDAGDVVRGRPNGVPVVADLASAMAKQPERLYIGVANIGGFLPDGFEATVVGALEAGLEVVNGLHLFLGDIEPYASAARRGGGRVVDVRRPPEASKLRVANGRIADLTVPRFAVLGMDCDIGKRVTAIEILRHMQARGLDPGFVATGQTGCMLGADAGVVVDRLPGDFAAGMVEGMVCDVAQQRSPVIIYAQSSIRHPAFSGVALSVLHGALPTAAILQVAPGRTMRALFTHPHFTMPDTPEAVLEEIELLERLGPTRIVGLAVNPSACGDPAAAVAVLERVTGLPAVDPLTGDVGRLVDALLATVEESGSVPVTG